MVLKGGRVAKAKIFKEKYEYEWNFQRGGGLKLKNPLWERLGYFLGQNILVNAMTLNK